MSSSALESIAVTVVGFIPDLLLVMAAVLACAWGLLLVVAADVRRTRIVEAREAVDVADREPMVREANELFRRAARPAWRCGSLALAAMSTYLFITYVIPS